ncbi:hypothetical protein GCM10010319_47220 [Streptomyces blastmyceticus]|uniref:DNA-binding protein n=1 Tax=Streptomyces blastmyceticus TaxID=68180 RepID=A0ABP3H7M2_9ACTN
MEDSSKALGFSQAKAYDLVRRGEFPERADQTDNRRTAARTAADKPSTARCKAVAALASFLKWM